MNDAGPGLPPRPVIAAFGLFGEVEPLGGGTGRSARVGGAVLKPRLWGGDRGCRWAAVARRRAIFRLVAASELARERGEESHPDAAHLARLTGVLEGRPDVTGR